MTIEKQIQKASSFTKTLFKYRGTIITIVFSLVVAFLLYNTLSLHKKLKKRDSRSRRGRRRRTPPESSGSERELDVSIRNYESHSETSDIEEDIEANPTEPMENDQDKSLAESPSSDEENASPPKLETLCAETDCGSPVMENSDYCENHQSEPEV